MIDDDIEQTARQETLVEVDRTLAALRAVCVKHGTTVTEATHLAAEIMEERDLWMMEPEAFKAALRRVLRRAHYNDGRPPREAK